MRIMHLADLHLGRSIFGQSLIEDQKYILNKIIDEVVNNNIDVILIAGDVYDKGIPSIDAVKLFSSFLTRLYNLDIKVFVIAGNHDSKDRLAFGNELFVNNGIYIEGVFEGKLRCVELEDDYGKVLIYMLPFVRPLDVKQYYDCEVSSYHDAVKCIIDDVTIDTNERNIIMVHQFVTSMGEGVDSDSINISLGGIDNVDVSIFDDFDYVAMGHVHRPQKLIRDTVRYAGSPLKYSFSEVNYNKSIPIIDIKEKGNISVSLIDLVPIRDMREIRGKLDNLLSSDVSCMYNKLDYVSAIITDDDYVMDAMGKLRSVYKNILRLEYQNRRTMLVENNLEVKTDVNKKSELELFSDFYLEQNNVELDDDRLVIIKEVLKKFLDN